MATVPEAMRGPAKGRPGDEPVVVFEDVRLAFDDNVVLDGISFKLYPGFTKIFIGASGSGKSTVLKLILGLLAPDRKPFADPCGGQRLPNGNTVIASYGAKKGIRIFEVTRDKKIVWTYEGKHGAHEIQILTTNGEPIAGAPLK